MRRTILTTVLALGLLAVGLVPGLAAETNDLRTSEDPFDLVHAAVLDGAEIVERSTERLDPDASSFVRFGPKKAADDVEPRVPQKLHPRLRAWLDRAADDDRLRVLVTYVDDLEIPRFPVPSLDAPRGSRENRAAMAESDALVRELAATRADEYRRLAAELEEAGGRVERTFWLVKAVAVDLPATAVEELAADERVQALEPRFSGEEPPADANPDNDVVYGRRVISSDPYHNLGQTTGYVGLLDTGVRDTHTVFTGPDRIDIQRDMTGGGNPDDDCWNHGTRTAAIITGNSDLGFAFRGATAITLDNLKVYTCATLDSAATVDGFQKAVQILDQVIVAEIQGLGSETSAIPTAADNAFDAGAVVISANGNYGPASGSVAAPGNAHKVLGIGAVDVESLDLEGNSGRGPTADGRYKPDLVAPTNTETASASGTTALDTYSGTSGATPYASAAAALMRNWQRHGSGSIDPGQVYAHLILSGQSPYPFDNDEGAGRLVMPTGAHAWWGKVSVGDGETIDIPIPVTAGKDRFEGALWWPEEQTGHNDVDLTLVDPSGVTRDWSVSVPSVFERARVDDVRSGTWKLRIRGYDVDGEQTVYWGAHTR